MLRTEMPKVLKVAILVLTILMMPFAQNAWAKSERSRSESSGRSERSERSKETSSVQRSERTSVQTRAVSSSPEARRTIREAPRSDAPTQRVSREPQRQNPSPVVNRPDFARPQLQLSNPSPAPRPAPLARPVNVAKPANRIVDQGRPARVASLLEQPTTGKGRPGKNRDGLKYDGKKSVRQKPADIVKPLAVTTRVHKDDSRTDTTVINRRDNKEPSGNIDQTVRNRDTDRGKQDNTRITDRRSEPRTPEQTRNFNHDWIASRHTAIGENSSDRRDFVRSPRNTVILRQDKDNIMRLRHTSTRGVVYEDRSRTFNRPYHHDFVSRDRHNRLNYSIISPRYSFPLCYNWGRHHSVRYVYPYYHRRYVFVSLGGFWPDYSCVRYYWYPSHSYLWYGYDPVAQEVSNDTYNYYTYNYYNTQPDYIGAATNTTGIATVDETTFADVREKLSKQQQPPAVETSADTLFDEGVKAFEQGSYAEAEEKFARAMAIAPDDLIMPFAYAQALLAQGKYTRAAEILRVVVQKSTPDKQGIFFPRGLYLDENTLDEQIDRLSEAAANNPADTDMQLLLGYQLLGIGETEKAIESLNAANTDGRNYATVNVLLDLAEKIKSGETK